MRPPLTDHVSALRAEAALADARAERDRLWSVQLYGFRCFDLAAAVEARAEAAEASAASAREQIAELTAALGARTCVADIACTLGGNA